jgi:hypothetical protein
MAWQVGDIVNQVIARTQNLADGKFDMRTEFFLGLDEFCNERHFWWRKKRFTFPSIVGTASYDISALAPDFAGEIEDLFLLNADGTTIERILQPIVTPLGEIAAINQTVQDTPAAYLLDVTTSLFTIRLQAPSNVNQPMFGTYWASPQVTDPDDSETIPLVPQNIHYGLFDMLERRVYKLLLAQDDPRFEASDATYQAFITKASRIPTWAGRKAREMAVDFGIEASGSSLSLGSRHGRQF